MSITTAGDLATFSLALSSFTGDLENKACSLRASISVGGAKMLKMKPSGPVGYLHKVTQKAKEVEEDIEGIENRMIGNPDELSMGEMADKVATLVESNQNKMNEIGIILRQYGYKGPNFPNLTKQNVNNEQTATIVDEEEDEEEDVEEVEEEEKLQEEEEKLQEEEEKEEEEVEGVTVEGVTTTDTEETTTEETTTEEATTEGATGKENNASSAEPATSAEPTTSSTSSDPANPSDYTTPPKPGSRPPKPETPPTPATPTLEGLSNVAQSVLRGSPLTSTKKFAREAAKIHNSAIKTPKITSVSERLA
ncbi:hypothetical protein TrRE_jg7849, partial [Triparma retinervis]